MSTTKPPPCPGGRLDASPSLGGAQRARVRVLLFFYSSFLNIKKVIKYTFRSVPMSFLHFAFVFRAREGAHALEENPDRTGTVHVNSPMLSEDGLEYTKAPQSGTARHRASPLGQAGELQPAARVERIQSWWLCGTTRGRHSQDTTPERSGSERCILILRYPGEVLGIHAVRRPSPQAVIGPPHKVTPSESRVGQNAGQKNVAARGYSAVKRASNEELGHASTSALSPGPGRQLDAPHAWRRLMRAQGRVTQEDNPERSGPERCMLILRYFPKGHLGYTEVAARQ